MRNLLRSSLRRIVGGHETGAPAPVTQSPIRPRRPRGKRSARVVAVAAQKGGVGKTTTSVNLAAAMARFHGKRVLLVDLDPQGHVSRSLRAQIHAGGGCLSEVLGSDGALEVLDVVTSTAIPGLDVTPGDQGLAQAENLLNARIGKELVLREALEVTKTWYDLIVLDCPPHLGNLTVGGLVAADDVLIPCDPSPLALTGVHALANAITGVARLNPTIGVLGVLLTRVDGRNLTLNEAIIGEIEGAFGDALLPVRVGINSALGKAQHAGEDIFAYAPDSRGARHYAALAAHLDAALTAAAEATG
jgi:chromosome partitioning protein